MENMQEEQVSPEEQSQYERMVSNAKGMMGGEQGDALFERMAHGDPVESIAHVVAEVVRGQAKVASNVGMELGPDVLFSAGYEIAAEYAEAAREAGILPEEATPDTEEFAMTLDQIVQKAAQLYQQEGNPEVRKAVSKELHPQDNTPGILRRGA
jgi:hypothetical protein